MVGEPDAPADPLDVLRSLVAEIAIGDYADRNGVPLKMNTELLKAQAVLRLAEVLSENRKAPGG